HPGFDGATNQAMFVGNDGGIFMTTNARGGTSRVLCTVPANGAGNVAWMDLNNNYGVTQFYHGVPFQGPDGGTSYFGGAQDNGTNFSSDADGPNGWQQLFGGDGGYVA